MKVPPFERFSGWMSGIGLFCAGAIVGSAVYMSLHQYNYSLLVNKNIQLASELSSMEKDLKAFKKNQNRKTLISKINVNFEENEDNEKLDIVVKTALESKILKLLDVARGKSFLVVQHNPLVYRDLIENKIFENVSDRDYTIDVDAIVGIESELSVWITAKEHIRPTTGVDFPGERSYSKDK